MNRKNKTLATVLNIAIVCSATLTGRAAPEAPKTTNAPVRLKIQENPIDRQARAPISFAPVAKLVEPSVVTIYSTMTIKERRSPLSEDPLFRRFFGDQFGQQEPREHKAEGLGSGVIVSADGYILTASHVVEGADSVKVALSTGEKEFDAKVIGTDPPTDVAVLKIDARKTLSAITLADSDKLEVGDIVLAVGNPFSVGETVTMGIISALGRGGFGITGYENFIQTDAAINPGNSGGALLDIEGRLVGINTAILSHSGGFQGVGFAVPINMARFAMDRLITYGKVTRGYLGINIQPVTPELARELGLPEEGGGVLVGGVQPNTPAAKAGVQDGDLILALNGKKVTDPRTLQLLIAQTAPNSKVTLQILRGEPGHKPVEKTVAANLDTLPQEELARGGSGGPSEPGGQGKSDVLDGVEVGDINAAARQEFNIPRNVRGAVVVNVAPDSPAARAGLRPGDVLVDINRHAVHNADEAVNLSDKITGDRLLLRVWSQAGNGVGGTHYVVIDNSKSK